jgi:VanZ family protein
VKALERLVARLCAAVAGMPALVRVPLPVVLAAALWWSSSREPSGARSAWFWSVAHNGMHVVAYAVLAAACWFALTARTRPRAALLVLGLAVLYGIADEIHQSHVPGRDASIADVVSDAFGAAIAVHVLRSDAAGRSWLDLRLALLVSGAMVSVLWATFL